MAFHGVGVEIKKGSPMPKGDAREEMREMPSFKKGRDKKRGRSSRGRR